MKRKKLERIVSQRWLYHHQVHNRWPFTTLAAQQIQWSARRHVTNLACIKTPQICHLRLACCKTSNMEIGWSWSEENATPHHWLNMQETLYSRHLARTTGSSHKLPLQMTSFLILIYRPMFWQNLNSSNVHDYHGLWRRKYTTDKK